MHAHSRNAGTIFRGAVVVCGGRFILRNWLSGSLVPLNRFYVFEAQIRRKILSKLQNFQDLSYRFSTRDVPVMLQLMPVARYVTLVSETASNGELSPGFSKDLARLAPVVLFSAAIPGDGRHMDFPDALRSTMSAPPRYPKESVKRFLEPWSNH
jgi:hypothetical protein